MIQSLYKFLLKKQVIAIKLYAHDLRGIADALDNLGTAHGIKITTFKYGSLTVTVDEISDQKDGRSLFVTSISDSIQSTPPPWQQHHRSDK